MAMDDPSSKIPQSALPSAMSAYKRAKELRGVLEAAENGKGVVLGMDKVSFSKQYGKSIAKELLEEDAIFTKLIKRIPGVEGLMQRLGGNAGAATTVAAEGAEMAADVGQQVAQAGAQQAVRSALPITQEAVETVLKGGNAYRELVKLGFNQQTASAISKGTLQYSDDVLKAALEGGDDALKALLTNKGIDAVKSAASVADDVVEAGAKAVIKEGAEEAVKAGAKSAVKEGAEEVVKKSGGFFGKLKGLFGGIKGNFVIAGLFSVIGNTMDLMSGKMNLPQFLALTVLDTGVYGGIGVASTALGAAIGTALFPGVGTVLGAVIAGGIGLAIGWGAGMVYEKVLRNPVKGMLGPTGGGQQGYDPNQPLTPPGQQSQDPLYTPQPGLPQIGPNGQIIPQQQPGQPQPQPQQGQVPPQGMPQQGQAPMQPGQPQQPAQPQQPTQPYVQRTEREIFAGANGSFWMAPETPPAAPAPAPYAAPAPYGAPAAPAAAPGGMTYEQAQAELARLQGG